MAKPERGAAFADTAIRGEAQAAAAGMLEPGALFAGRYRVEALIGTGGMGAVYRVHDLRLDERVALKVMTFTHEEAARRFADEVRLARRVTHANVARTHDLGEHEGVPYLTMEYVDGETLETLIEREGAVPARTAARVATQIAAGLSAAHDSGVIHRDLKPANVLLAGDGRALITDFGIARALRSDAKQTAGIIGTPAYMSPEQACGAPLDARSDIYSLGIILYELLSASLPFDEIDTLAMVLARVNSPAIDLRTRGAIDERLAALVMAMLARDPPERPASAEEVRAELEAFLAGSMTRTQPHRLRAPVSPGEHALAVLPFRYRGADEHGYLGEGLAEELIDAISRTRGLRVLALGAVARFSKERDPIRVGAELGVDSLVDGTVQQAAGRLRVSVRLHDAKHGVQIWSDRLDIAVEDLFTLQESLAKRIAEALRLELQVRPVGRQIPSEAIELYMRARHLLRSGVVGSADEAVAELERCLVLAPDLPPALGAHAMASVRSWWLESTMDLVARADRARVSVARALEQAGDQAESQLASATYAVQTGAYREGIAALDRALQIAPTLAEAHQHLASLEAEAGRPRQAEARARLALELDPSLNLCRIVMTRLLAYDGRLAESKRIYGDLVERMGQAHPGALINGMRLAMLARDEGEIARLVTESKRGTSWFSQSMAAFFAFLVDEIDIDRAAALVLDAGERFLNPRFQSAMMQVTAEMYAYKGHHERALAEVVRVSDGILIDVVWLESCPILAPLRGEPAFAGALGKVRDRVAHMWSR